MLGSGESAILMPWLLPLIKFMGFSDIQILQSEQPNFSDGKGFGIFSTMKIKSIENFSRFYLLVACAKAE